MLELTRRMTKERSNFVRLAGAYMDEEGYVDNSFNVNFLKLEGAEKQHCLDIAKAVIFADTNTKLKSYRINEYSKDSIWQLLYALRACELKNDALLDTLYEMIADKFKAGSEYAIYVYYGVYDVPLKGTDKERQNESEEVYSYIIVAICPMKAEYEADLPVAGLLYPAFTDRSTDMNHANIYNMI